MVLFIICTLLPLFFIVLQQCLTSRKNNVYSQDTSVNEKVNRLEKYTWSVALLIADYARMAAGIYLVLRITLSHELFFWDYIIYIAADMIGSMAFIGAIILIHIKYIPVLNDSLILPASCVWPPLSFACISPEY